MDKMYIQAYSTADYSQKAGDKFTVLVNPETYKFSYTVEFSDAQAPGTSAVNLRFNRMPPQNFNFDFIFDGTGVVTASSLLPTVSNPLSNSGSSDVIDQIETFKHTVFNYQGDIHRPYFLKLHWGTLSFKGVLTSLDIEFKLFNPDGSPVRAVAKAGFRGSVEDNLRAALEDRQSPDITHKRVFQGNDTFVLLTNSIYNSEQYYIPVAAFNKLNSFRKIKQGTALYFPPVSQS